MNMKRLMCNLAVGLMITACGGGGGGSDDSAPAETKMLDGVYTGSLFREDTQEQFFMLLMVYEGEVVGFAEDGYDLPMMEGRIGASGGNFDGRGTGYVDGEAYNASLNGTYSIGETLDGNFDVSGLAGYTFFLDYHANSTAMTTISTISGDWVSYGLGVTTRVSLDGNGSISGGDSTGCDFSGQVTKLDGVNIFDVELVASRCLRQGTYHGLGSIDGSDTFYVGASGGDPHLGVFMPMERE